MGGMTPAYTIKKSQLSRIGILLSTTYLISILLPYFFILAKIKRMKFSHVGLPNNLAMALVEAT